MANAIVEIELETGDSPRNLKSLRDQLDAATEELEQIEDSDAFNKQAKEVRKLGNEVLRLEKKYEALDPSAIADSFIAAGEGITGAFVAAQGAAVLFGDESEELSKRMMQAEAAISIALGVRAVAEGLVQGRIAATITMEKARLVLTKAATVAQKAFNLVMKANPIILLATVIAGLVLSFFDLKDILGVVKSSFKFMFLQIKVIIEGIKELWGILKSVGSAIGGFFSSIGSAVSDAWNGIDRTTKKQSEATIKRISKMRDEEHKLVEQLKKRAKESTKTAKEVRKSYEEELKAITTRYNREIELAQAAGKETSRLRSESLKQQIKLSQNVLEANEKSAKANTELLEAEQDRAFDVSKRTDIFDEVRKRKEAKRAAEEVKQQKETLETLNFQLEVFETEQKQIKIDAGKERAQELADLQRELEDSRLRLIEDDLERERETIKKDFNRQIEEIKGDSKVELALRKSLAMERDRAIAELEDTHRRESDERSKKADAEREKKLMEKAKAMAEAFNDDQINQAQLELDRIQEEGMSKIEAQRNLLKVERDVALQEEGLTATEKLLIQQDYNNKRVQLDKDASELIKQQRDKLEQAQRDALGNSLEAIQAFSDVATKDSKKAEAVNRALAVAQISIDLARSISSTIAGATAAASAGGPAAPFLLASYIASGLASVFGAFKSAEEALGSSTGVSEPNAGPAPAQAQAPEIPQGVPTTEIQQNQNFDVTAKVIESEVTDTQKKVNNIKNKAAF